VEVEQDSTQSQDFPTVLFSQELASVPPKFQQLISLQEKVSDSPVQVQFDPLTEVEEHSSCVFNDQQLSVSHHPPQLSDFQMHPFAGVQLELVL